MAPDGNNYADKVKEALKKHSEANIDEYVQAFGFKNEEVHKAVQNHIWLEWKSWFFYRKLAADAGRANVGLHGFAMFFKRSAAECFADGMWLENYLIQRGGRSGPSDIPAPKIDFPDAPVDPIIPVYEALQVEKAILEDCLKLTELADKNGDAALEDAIETRFLQKETRHVKDMGDFLQQCVRVSKDPGHGVYHLDKELRQNEGNLPWTTGNNPDKTDALLEKAYGDLKETPLFG